MKINPKQGHKGISLLPNCLSMMLLPLVPGLLAIYSSSAAGAETKQLSAAQPKHGPFTAVDADRGILAPILIPRASGYDWDAISSARLLHPQSAEAKIRDAALFLREAIERLTGVAPEIKAADDAELNAGILFVFSPSAPDEIRNAPAIAAALRDDGSDSYNHREAFFLRSEPNRLLIVANTADGIAAAVPALMESVDYEVLGMGPNWIYSPAGGDRTRLVFDLAFSDRPGFYLRRLSPTSGQGYGAGTISRRSRIPLNDPADEFVEDSWRRWSIAIRNRGNSMAPFPGHAMYRHHRAMVEKMIATGSEQGFLVPEATLGLDSERPEATEELASHLWINTDPEGSPGFQRVFLCSGQTWEEQKLNGMRVNLDLTSAAAREVVLIDLKSRAAKHFSENPEQPLIYGTEAEDGAGYANIGEWTRPENRNWYPDYLRERAVAWPRAYALHGHRGIDQPGELYDPASPADVVFAFNNWLLAEFDRWIDSLPEPERVTAAGRPKKDLIRLSLYSYAFHDIPPHHNLDPRIRVMIAGYPKHRGHGEWKNFATRHEVAGAFRILLPREPSGVYRIPSIAYYADHNLNGIANKRNLSPAAIVEEFRGYLDSGIRAYTAETDFNFGKFGLGYYLMSRVLWNPDLSVEQLDGLRDRWLRRAYGSGWKKMKQYHDFMLSGNLPVNAPGAWARAIRMIDEADAAVDSTIEPDASRRIDDMKQFWYYYYLLDSGRAKPDSSAMIEFAWKGQMSYATAMHMVLKRVWNTRKITDVVPGDMRSGPARFSRGETASWWNKILEHWPVVEVTHFSGTTLSDGTPAGRIDVNDLVRVEDFGAISSRERPFLYNGAQAPPAVFLTVARAGEDIGFQLSWPSFPERPPQFYGPKEIPYGIEYRDTASRSWQAVADITRSLADSRLVENAYRGKPRHVAEIRRRAGRTGTYRIEVGRGGLSCFLSSLGYNLSKELYTSRPPHTYIGRLVGHTQEPVYIYIPKGTKSLDLEVWNTSNRKVVELYKGGLIQEDGKPAKPRQVNISRRGVHRIALAPGEDGNLARIGGNGFAFPALYSIPSLWAKNPAELLIPRAVAEADGLKVVE